MQRPSNLPPGWQPPAGKPSRNPLRAKREAAAHRDNRYARWHVPLAAEREPDGWLLSYLDLVTLLLVVFAVMLAITKMNLGAAVADDAGTVVAGAAVAQHEAEGPAAGTAREDAPAVQAATASAEAPPQPEDKPAGTPAAADGATAGTVTPPAARQDDAGAAPASPDEPAASPEGAAVAATPSPSSEADPAVALIGITPPADAGLPALGADAPDAGASAQPGGTDAAGSPIIVPATPDGDTAVAQADDGAAAAPPPVTLVSSLRLANWNPMPGLDLAAHASRLDLPPEPALPTPEQLGLDALGEGIDVIVNEKSISFRISSEILFASGQADLMPSGVTVLERLVDVLKRNNNLISVEGHSDPIPIQNNRFPSNWDLSASRATSVLRHLERNGIAPERLRATGYAHTRPIAPNDTAAGRAANRRVELIMETQRADG